ncbi:MAG: DUF11 domain-containing protein [Methylococcaceae bacterium]|nr:DUF11 domain-containing protein [Methylococcaceae bacterium]
MSPTNAVTPHYKYIINVDNTGTTEQRNAEPGSGCSVTDSGYPGTCNWTSVAGVQKGSFAPIYTQGDSVTSPLTEITSMPPGRYLISIQADGYGTAGDPSTHYFYKLDGTHFTVPASGTPPDLEVELVNTSTNPLPAATIQAEIFEDNVPTNSAPDVPAERGLAGWLGQINDYLGPVTTDVFGNPLCAEYDSSGNYVAGTGGQCVSKCYVVSGGQDIGTVAPADADGRCPIDTTGIANTVEGKPIPAGAVIEGKLKIPNVGPNRYALSATPPLGSDWVQTTTLEGNHDWDAWVMEGATGLDTEFVVGGEPFPATFFGFVKPTPTAVLGSGANITGSVRHIRVYVPAQGGFVPNGSIWGGLAGAWDDGPIERPWLSLNDVNNGDQAIWVGQGNADGTFSIPGVPAGTYTLTWWDEPQNQILDLVNVTVLPTDSTVDMGTLPLSGWWTKISGFVFNDVNRNGKKDPGETGLNNMVLTMKKRENSVMDRGATGERTHNHPVTGEPGYYEMVNAYPMTQWLVEEMYTPQFYTTGVTYQADNQPAPTTVIGSGVDVNVLPIIGLGGTLDWGLHAYDGAGSSCSPAGSYTGCVDPRNGGIVGTVTYDTTRNELDPRYAVTEIWQPGIPDLTVNLYAPLLCTDPTTQICSTGALRYQLNADGSYKKGPLLNQYITETWERPTNLTDPSGCKARGGDTNVLTHSVTGTEFVLPTTSGADCLEGPLMGMQFGPNAADGSFGASVNGNYGFGEACYSLSGTTVTWGTFNPANGSCSTGTSMQPIPGGRDYLVEVEVPNDALGRPMYQVTKEEDINIANGDVFVPAAPPPACAGPLHIVDVKDSGTDGWAAPTNAASLPAGVTVPVLPSVPVENPTLADPGGLNGSPYEGQAKPLCNVKLINVANGVSIAPNFNYFTDVPLPGRHWGLIVDDLNFSSNVKSLDLGEKAGVPFAPVGIYDWANKLVYTTESDYNGLFDVLLPSTNRISCPTPSGVCANLYRFVGNDPGAQGRLNPNYNPQFRTIAAEFETFPGLLVPADLAPTQVGVTVQLPGGQTTQPVQCPVEPTRPQLFALNTVDGPRGTSVTISGLGFGNSRGSGVVSVGGVNSTNYATWNDTQITFTVPNSTPRGPQQLSIRAGNGLSTINGITFHVTGGSGASGYNPTIYRVGPGRTYPTIQAAIDAAEIPNSGNRLIVVYPGEPQGARINPFGAYYENLIVSKPIKLQGVGPGGFQGATWVPGSIIDGGGFVGDSQIFNDWQTKIAALQAIGWVGTQSIYEGADVTWFARTTTAFGSSYRAAIDGFDLRGGNQQGFPANINQIGGGPTGLPPGVVTQGGAIFANAYTHYLQITNNVVQNNGGSYGTIRIGTPNLTGNDPNEGTNQHNDNVLIANNRIVANGGTNLAGGIGLFAGSDNYEVRNNDICGNFSAEYGGGISQYGRNTTGVGQIHDNRIYFNRSYDEGGGIMIAGALPVDPNADYGTPNGPQGTGPVDIHNNLIQSNQANDDGGGIRFLMAGNFTMNVYNNMIVNNVSTHEGGGVALDDAPAVNFINNTVMKNITTATAVTSTGQPAPAGLSTAANSVQLTNTGVAAVTPPVVRNTSFWDNRAGTRAGPTVTGIGLPGDATPVNIWDYGFADGSGTITPTNSWVGSNPGVVTPFDTVLTFQPWRNNPALLGAIMVTQDVAPSILGDYHLLPTANGINGGNPTGAPTFDIDNQTRTGNPDIGADEYVAAPILADLSISKTDGVTSVSPGQAVTYTIVVSNAGPSSASATVADTMPTQFTGASWTCTAVTGATCPAASGTGNISGPVALSVGTNVTFAVNATVVANPTATTVANTATVAATGGITDPSTGNNSATDSDAIVVPLPTLSVLDNFNRANANTLGTNWSQTTTGGNAAVRIFSNQAGTPNLVGGSAFWNAATFGNKQGAAFTFSAAPLGIASPTAVILKANGGTATAPANYITVGYLGLTSQVVVSTTVGATTTQRGTIATSFANGDTLTAVADAGGVVNVWKNSTWIGSVTLPTSGGNSWTTGSGRIGLQIPASLIVANARVDNFAGGTLP